MIATESVLAIIALVVSLIALLVALSQFRVQLFATAEGSRRCSNAVIGLWSTGNKWKWHWSEGRYETYFVSPHIVLLDREATMLIENAYTRQQSLKSLLEAKRYG